jgi:DNA-binding MarR family transcriptional regulator
VHSTASRLVDRAVRAGMITRHRALADPRRTVLALTREGLRLQREAVHFRTGRLADMLADWSASEVATFARLLERFARSTHTTMEESS